MGAWVSRVLTLAAFWVSTGSLFRSALRSDEEKKKALFETLMDEIEDHALLCCAIRVRPLFVTFEESVPNGSFHWSPKHPTKVVSGPSSGSSRVTRTASRR